MARDPLPAVVAFASTYTDTKPQLNSARSARVAFASIYTDTKPQLNSARSARVAFASTYTDSKPQLISARSVRVAFASTYTDSKPQLSSARWRCGHLLMFAVHGMQTFARYADDIGLCSFAPAAQGEQIWADHGVHLSHEHSATELL